MLNCATVQEELEDDADDEPWPGNEIRAWQDIENARKRVLRRRRSSSSSNYTYFYS